MQYHYNYILYFISFFLLICCVKPTPQPIESQTIIDSLFYHNGNIKSISSFYPSKKEKYIIEFYLNGDTSSLSLLKKEELIYHLAYDSTKKKISDERKLYLEETCNKYFTYDTITFYYYIKGPDRDKMLMSAATGRYSPDTIGVPCNLLFDSITERNIVTFTPKVPGKYKIKASAIDKKLLKAIAYEEIIIEVK